MTAMVERSAREEADAGITALYDAQWVPMVRLAWLLTHDQSVAEEIVQDALVRIHARWDRIADTGQVHAYLRASVVNGARSALRHRRVVDRRVTDDVASGRALGATTSPSAEDEAVHDATRSELVGLLRRLPRRQREVLALRYFLDLSEAEIARTLDISPGAVKAHAHRGLASLRAAHDKEAAR